MGVRDPRVREKALQKSMTLEELHSFARGLEQARAQARAIEARHQSSFAMSSTTVQAQNKVEKKPVPPTYPKKMPQQHHQSHHYPSTSRADKCSRCKSPRHPPWECPFKHKECFKCGKTGHTQSACRTKQGQARPKRVQTMDLETGPSLPAEDAITDDACMLQIHHAGDQSALHDNPAVETTVEVDGKPVRFEVDTGAAVSVMSKQLFCKLWPRRKVDKSQQKLKTYTGEAIPVVGEVTVAVKEEKLPLIIVQGSSKPLLGRNWLSKVRLNWHDIFQVKASLDDKVEELLNMFPDLTKKEMGKARTEAQLVINPDTNPVFCKPRPIPLALRPQVEKELNRQIEAGILKPCKTSQWAAPLVTIMKPDGSVRLCGSYNLTVNRACQLEQYPLPKVDELITQLAGGEKFSVITWSRPTCKSLSQKPVSSTQLSIHTNSSSLPQDWSMGSAVALLYSSDTSRLCSQESQTLLCSWMTFV